MSASGSRRATVVAVIPALVLAGLVVPAVVLAGRLPDPVAIHWGISGRPNGHAPWWAYTALSGILWCAAWATLVRHPVEEARWTVANIYALGGVLLTGHAVVLWANLDKASWEAARHLPGYGIALPAILVVAAVFGAVGWVLVGEDEPRSSTAPPSIGLGPAERGVWAGSAGNRWLLAAVPVAAVAAVLIDDRRALIVIAAVVAVALWFSHVSVIAGPAGVTIRLGLLGWPRRHIGLDQISEARAISVAPLAYGGWGWRRRPGRTAVVVRGGEGLELQLTNGRAYVVTVDGATQAAGLINDLLSRRTPIADIGP